MIVWPDSCVWRTVSISKLANYQITKLPLPPLSLSPGDVHHVFLWRELGERGEELVWKGRGGGLRKQEQGKFSGFATEANLKNNRALAVDSTLHEWTKVVLSRL